jgi:pantetheine-phosphate adenylyltransferase
MRRAVYPGSFDPLTNGHVNVIQRGLHLVDELIVGVLRNANKQPMFSVEERVEMIREAFPDNDNLTVQDFDGLLVNFVQQNDCSCILRGLRAVSDFEYEYQMANMNRHLAPGVDTIFLMADPKSFYVSSGLVKEVGKLGGDVEGTVPPHVRKRLNERVNSNQ